MPTGLCRGYVTLAASGAIYLYGEYVYIYIYISIYAMTCPVNLSPYLDLYM